MRLDCLHLSVVDGLDALDELFFVVAERVDHLLSVLLVVLDSPPTVLEFLLALGGVDLLAPLELQQ